MGKQNNKKAMLTKIMKRLGFLREADALKTTVIIARAIEYRRLRNVKRYLDLMDGMPADQWAKNAYAYIERLTAEAEEDIREYSDMLKPFIEQFDDEQ